MLNAVIFWAFLRLMRNSALSGPFALEDLPAAWRALWTAVKSLPFIAKYEVTNLQWHAVMDASCPDSQNLPADAASP